MLERIFKINAHGSTVDTEVLAGATSPIAMAHIIFVDPAILQVAGMGMDASFTSTLCGSVGHTWQQGLAVVSMSGVIFSIVTVMPLRGKIISAISSDMESASPGASTCPSRSSASYSRVGIERS
ncbi:MAG: hypothetical protein IJR14_05745 [Synergistaceae bacterium]|nr:hypothetical protein [Synergistaceae bacterium]